MSTARRDSSARITWFLACGLLAAPLAAGDSPWYVNGRFGQAAVKRDFGVVAPGTGWAIDDEHSAGSIELGYTLHPHLALQAGYHDLGSFRGLPRPCPAGESCPEPLASGGGNSILPVFPAELDLTGYSFALVPRWGLGERASLYGKLGVLAWDSELIRPGDGQRVGTPSGDELLVGAGADYAFGNGFGLLIEYEHSDLVREVSLGGSWRF